MDQIREAFQKVKQDLISLHSDIDSLKIGLNDLSYRLSQLSKDLKELKEKPIQPPVFPSETPQTTPLNTSTHNTTNQTNATYTSTHNILLEALKPQIMHISTRNEGVSTDRQTHRQTDRHIENIPCVPENTQEVIFQPKDLIQNAAAILDSLDSLKKEIRLKFKRLTAQELLVFSTLYQLDEDQGFADYKTLAQRLNLTQSSIRDYVGRLIEKGISVDKIKINNKSVQLRVSKSLKKVASLPTILKLRGI